MVPIHKLLLLEPTDETGGVAPVLLRRGAGGLRPSPFGAASGPRLAFRKPLSLSMKAASI